jgi:methylisocitrate lyase
LISVQEYFHGEAMKKSTILRKLILDEKILVMPGAYDATSAKIIEQTGFKAITLGGYPSSASLLGKPDVSLLTLTEMVNYTRNIVEAVDIPVFTDGDTGHGNVTNVIRTVREFEKTGVAGFFLEDQVFPKRCGHMEGKQVIPTEEMVPKIKAAVDSREDHDFVIMARTDALAIYGIDEAIERANRYKQAGADLIFIEAPNTKNEMIRINKEVDAPTMAIQIEGGKTPMFAINELEKIGYNVVVFPLSALYAAAWAVRKVMRELLMAGTTLHSMDFMLNFSDFNQLIGLNEIREKERYYYKDLFEA